MFGTNIKLRDLIRMRRAMKDFQRQQKAAGNLPTLRDYVSGGTEFAARLADPARQAELLAAVTAIPGNPQAITEGNPDQLTQLERLGALKKNGSLTDAEFELEKAKILTS